MKVWKNGQFNMRLRAIFMIANGDNSIRLVTSIGQSREVRLTAGPVGYGRRFKLQKP